MRDLVAYRYHVIAQQSFLTTNSQKVAPIFERPDWTLFRSLGTLGQKAGVPLRRLAALVVKELVDNALDAGATAQVERCGDWIHVINLGLDPWEALDMDLQVEKFRELGGKRDRQLPVAEYVPRRWKDWLQTQRVELNAMTSPEFIRWLNSKFAEHADKVVPPAAVLREELDGRTRRELERLLAAEILAAGGFAERVETAMVLAREKAKALNLEKIVRDGLNQAPEQRWDAPLLSTAEVVAADVTGS